MATEQTVILGSGLAFTAEAADAAAAAATAAEADYVCSSLCWSAREIGMQHISAAATAASSVRMSVCLFVCVRSAYHARGRTKARKINRTLWSGRAS